MTRRPSIRWVATLPAATPASRTRVTLLLSDGPQSLLHINSGSRFSAVVCRREELDWNQLQVVERGEQLSKSVEDEGSYRCGIETECTAR